MEQENITDDSNQLRGEQMKSIFSLFSNLPAPFPPTPPPPLKKKERKGEMKEFLQVKV